MNLRKIIGLKKTPLKSERLLKYTAFQSVIYPLAGICQILFVLIISTELSFTNLKQALFILNLSTIFIFLDFGTVYQAFRTASSNINSEDSIKREIVIHFQRKAIRILLFLLVIGITSIVIFQSITYGIYIILTGLITPGLISMHLMRGFGLDLRFLITYNISWPISLLMLFTINSLDLNQINYEQFIAFLPLISSTITGISAYMHISKLYGDRHLSSKIHKLNDSKLDFIKPTLLTMTSGLSFHVDKLYLMYSNDIEHIEIYMFYGLLANSVVSMLSSIGSISWGDNLGKKMTTRIPHLIEFALIGLVFSIMYLFAVIFLVWSNLTSIDINVPLLILMCFLINLNALVVVIQSKLTFSNKLVIRINGNLIQILLILFLLSTMNTLQSLIGTSTAVIVATLIHLIYLIISISRTDRTLFLK
jgi:hypothetical protein